MEDRKKDHIELALNLKDTIDNDPRFFYEPMLSSLSTDRKELQREFLGKTCHAPLWISSMTGGLDKGREINLNLSRAAHEFKLVFALGSCRTLLKSDQFFRDFNMRPTLGDDVVFLANLGVAQLCELMNSNGAGTIKNVLKALDVDGLVVHVNPLQEWIQPEGDRWDKSPLEIIDWCLDKLETPIIVKEVGQGFGPRSMEALSNLPLAAVEFASYGGTNFSKIEWERNTDRKERKHPLNYIGHTASEMVSFLSQVEDNFVKNNVSLVFSGGMKSSIDGHYYMSHYKGNTFYGQASTLLQYALKSQSDLSKYIESELANLLLAQKLLEVRKEGES